MRFKDKYCNNIVSLGGAALLMSSTCAAPVALIVKLWTTLKRTHRLIRVFCYGLIICASSNSTFFIQAWRPSRVSDPR